MFLTEDELIALTHRCRGSAQARVLRSMGIEHKTRPDGSLAVLAAHVARVMGEAPASKIPRKTQPNLALVS